MKEIVEQADRDCRDDLVRLIKEGVLDRAGKREINIADVEIAFIQRIARHRIEATRTNDQAKDEEIARLREAIENAFLAALSSDISKEQIAKNLAQVLKVKSNA